MIYYSNPGRLFSEKCNDIYSIIQPCLSTDRFGEKWKKHTVTISIIVYSNGDIIQKLISWLDTEADLNLSFPTSLTQ